MSAELYPGITFSPQATLTNNLGADGEGENVLYTAKTADALSGCQRGIEGEAWTWAAGELIGRNFTAKDHADLIAAVSETRDAAITAKEAADTADTASQAARRQMTRRTRRRTRKESQKTPHEPHRRRAGFTRGLLFSQRRGTL